MPYLMDSIRTYLDRQFTAYSVKQESEWEDSISFEMDSGKQNHKMTMSVINDERHLYLFSDIGLKIPRDKKPVIAEFITRINHTLRIGYFVMDFDEGDVQYKYAQIVADGELTYNAIDYILNEAFLVIEETQPGFESILDDGKTALEAYRIV